MNALQSLKVAIVLLLSHDRLPPLLEAYCVIVRGSALHSKALFLVPHLIFTPRWRGDHFLLTGNDVVSQTQ